MVKIRLKRTGSHKRPCYKIVVADARSPRDGKFIEQVGFYHPLVKENNFKIDMEKVKKWIFFGAKPTDTVSSLIRKVEKIGS
ncbi:MAG: 30S ribosomal protein S16 [Candidatus Improbicoccus pseudotrichonymphae]|uniref:Small ribosomal subunit protein bS16 n=1 Tax=Candidatus Improbicoccus pseudotrichonymphae TaxID=3033792 RepID=A0AA48I2K7_9FIRM|nr:MAG: 30S ribosomal protein S16 [Candidatus Improbicoccus pseudotrichonymphae]